MDELLEIVFLVVYILSIWAASFIFDIIYLGPAGQVLVGMALGEPILRIVPFPDTLVLVGKIGIMMTVFEGGLHSGQIRMAGKRSFAAAVAGIVLPILLGYIVFVPLNYETFPALIAGAALSSSSLQVILDVLSQKKQLDTPLGQLISTTAMVENGLSLLILSFMIQTSKSVGTIHFGRVVFQTLAVSFGAFGIGIAFTALFATLENPAHEPPGPNSNSPKTQISPPTTPINKENVILIAKAEQTEEVFNGQSGPLSLSSFMVACMLVLATLGGVATGEAGVSYLVGAYAAGIAFSTSTFAREVWEHKASAVTTWFSAIFFSSIGFLIPVELMLSSNFFGYGALFAGVQVLGKLICGLFAPDFRNDGWLVGWGMVTRGKLGFALAVQSFNSKLIPPDLFVIVLWALFLSALAPFPFSYLLSKRHSPNVGIKTR